MKKILWFAIFAIISVSAFAQGKTVQVMMPEVVNIGGTEASWLPGLIQDKLKSNIQEYLGMKTVVDSKSESALKQLQRESENSGRDENTAIELGKISTAQFVVMTKIRKTGKGYTISVDYTDMTTGEQKATATSKEYKSIDELYESAGAIDKITLALAEKLNIAITPIQKQALMYGTSDFSIDDQMKLAKQNEERYKNLMSQFDEQLRQLSTSSSLDAVENIKKIEAEKALLAERQQSEKKRLRDLEEQKKQAEADAKLEAQRSDAQKKARDELSARAEKKAAEVRKQKVERQGVLAQINVIESKKKALVEIRESIDGRIDELKVQMENDKKIESDKIRNEKWSNIETDGNGEPTKDAKQRRESKINEVAKKIEAQFNKDVEVVKNVASKQENDLLAEIRSDQNEIKKMRTVSSMGEELKASFGSYSGTNKGWDVYLSLYSDGALLHNETFIISYEAVTDKKPADLNTANDSAVADYESTVDMYNSLLLRGDPILYFEMDYSVSAQDDNSPSAYTFNFKEVRAISTITKKVLQRNSLDVDISRTMTPQWDIRTKEELLAAQKKEEHIAKKVENKKYFQDTSKFIFGASFEANKYSIDSIAPSVGLLMEYVFYSRIGIGLKTNFCFDILPEEDKKPRKNSNVTTIEPLGFIRYYTKPSILQGFLEVQGGAALIKPDGSDLKYSFSIGGGTGFRLRVEKFFMDWYVRGGYPYLFGCGFSMGMAL